MHMPDTSQFILDPRWDQHSSRYNMIFRFIDNPQGQENVFYEAVNPQGCERCRR